MSEAKVVMALVQRDLIAMRRSRAIIAPMIAVPVVLLILFPLTLALFVKGATETDVQALLDNFPENFSRPVLSNPEQEQPWRLVFGYLMAPLFLIIPLMVAAVLAADAFAGERERKTLEGLLHLPVSARTIFLAKSLIAVVPAVVISWIGFFIYSIMLNAMSWGAFESVWFPNAGWLLLIGWVGPALTTLALGALVRVSARAKSTQEANLLGSAVVLPLVVMTVAQAAALLLAPAHTIFFVGLLVWGVAIWLVRGGMRRFTRDRLGASA